jgi:GAF domain-containing protein
MNSATDPIVDPNRLEALAALRLHEPAARVLLNGLATQAAEMFQLPVGLVSIVLDDAQWFAGNHGLGGWLGDVGGTPIEWSFCSHVVRNDAPLVVPDAHDDPRFATNPLVTEEGIRCYVGTPLVTRGGHVIGALCVIDVAPRAVEESEVQRLRALAAETMTSLEMRRGA